MGRVTQQADASLSRPHFADLTNSNALIGHRADLDANWERDGYWYFKGVLDLGALAHFRQPILDELKGLGIVDQDAQEPIYNGSSLDSFPERNVAGYEPLPGQKRSRRWRDFLANPKVNDFFAQVLGGQPAWVPVAELRVMPPGEDPALGLFTYPHQDGFYNEGYRSLTAWMPLWPVLRDAGGLVVAEGMHKGPYLHDVSQPPRFPIPADAIPESAWRTADYQAGDVVLFDRGLPHSGLHNHSDKYFRVSFDVRCILPGDPAPVVGEIVSADAESVVVRDENGAVLRYLLDEESFCRGCGRSAGGRLALDAVAAEYPAGQEVMLTVDGDRVKLMREPKY
jgi:Phytanoyl-CoA dioxygenase (PhyH)